MRKQLFVLLSAVLLGGNKKLIVVEKCQLWRATLAFQLNLANVDSIKSEFLYLKPKNEQQKRFFFLNEVALFRIIQSFAIESKRKI